MDKVQKHIFSLKAADIWPKSYFIVSSWRILKTIFITNILYSRVSNHMTYSWWIHVSSLWSKNILIILFESILSIEITYMTLAALLGLFPFRKLKKERKKKIWGISSIFCKFLKIIYNGFTIVSATSSLWEKYAVIIYSPRLLFDIFLNHSDSALPNVKIIPLNREDGSKAGIRFLKSELVLM